MTTIDQIIAEKLGSWYIGEWPIGNFFLCFIALVLSVLLCGAVGLEREWRGRSAGLRTHLLVGVGSCMVMIISIYGFPQAFAGRDVARLAAQVITGVGFLGAGAIIHRNGGIRGLTTAATIWIVMAIGLACGSMNFLLAIASTVLIMIVILGMRGLESRIGKHFPTIVLVAPADKAVLATILDVCTAYSCKTGEIDTQKVTIDAAESIQITFKILSSSKNFEVERFVEDLRLKTGASDVQILSHH